MTLKVKWIDSGRDPQCPPDPRWPQGKAIDVSGNNAISCKGDLPYPAPRCGVHHVTCDVCGWSIGITAAGRPDDPISVRLPCRPQGGMQ